MSGARATQAFYTRWSRLYDAIARKTPGVHRVRSRAVGALAPDPGDVVVDMGCGTGANFRYLRDRVGPEGVVVGVDFSPGVLDRARDRVTREGWTNVHVVRGDVTALPVSRADAVFASFVSGMLGDPGATVEEWADLVGAGGRLAGVDLARSTSAHGRALNPLFRLVVRASAPPGSARQFEESLAGVLDARVAAAHRTLLERTRDGRHEATMLGFVRLSAGRVPP
jgi:ubiquinone/menaquinone biosynthesis C-methylase UbiE